jgi:hypothetical protein
MTIKEIAAAVGKDERTVQRWVKKAGDKMSDIMSPATHPTLPADYTREETLAIIEAGLGKNAAGIFRASMDANTPHGATLNPGVIRELRIAVTKGYITPRQFRETLGIRTAELPALSGRSSSEVDPEALTNQFITICPHEENEKVRAQQLYNAFRLWAIAHDVYQIPGRGILSQSLANMRFRKTKSAGRTFYHGIGIPDLSNSTAG